MPLFLTTFTTTLAYRPFLDPINAYGWWLYLAFPLLIGISIVYKAIRLPSMRRYWPQVIKMSAQLILVLIVIAVALYLLVEVALPYM